MSDRPYWCEICARKKECYGITLKPKCFVPMADRKTENSSEKPNNCENHSGEVTEMVKDEPSVSEMPTGSEPQMDGYMTAEQTEYYRKMLDKAKHKVYGNIEDEPQTEKCPFDDPIPCEWVCPNSQTDCAWK